MPRKGENIYKRKDGRWEGRYIAAMMKTIRPNMFTFTGKLIPKLNRS